ncbi:transcription elongation factor B polypeptide 3-like [Brevipalpus obovatus]|uniref:transcription elongation factor B polypeptide 3-like n=1 Tax=Brevipalpus obovatus TaxID=246614 RepID=UPI003D9FA58A
MAAPPINKVKTRSKVFSGTVRNVGQSTVPRLEDLCIRVLCDNHDRYEKIGDAPYWLIKPMLEKCTAKQLLDLENHNPRLTEDDDELWKWHCKNEYREYKREEDESWRDLYTRAQMDREAKFNRIKEKFVKKEQSKDPVRNTKLVSVDQAKPPRNVRRLMQKMDPKSSGGKSYGASTSSTSSSGTGKINGRPSSAPSLQPAKKAKGTLFKNCLKMAHNIRRQNC